MKLLWIIAGTVAAAAIVCQAIRSRRLPQAEGFVNGKDYPRFHLDRTIVVPTAMAAGSIAVWMRVSHGNTLKYTFVPAMLVSWVLYLRFLRQRMPDPEKITAFYLLSLAWQLVHFVEENSTGFRYRWPVEIFGTKPYGDRQYVAINALSYAVFLAGGVALLKRRPEFSLPAVFFAVMGVMYNGVQHPIYSFLVKGYFPGLWTGLVDLVMGPFLLRRLLASPKSVPVTPKLPVAA